MEYQLVEGTLENHEDNREADLDDCGTQNEEFTPKRHN